MNKPQKIFSALDQFGLVEVSGHSTRRDLYLGNEIVQSSVDTERPERPVLEYVRGMSLILKYPGRIKRVLVLGIGGGSLISALHHFDPGIEIHGVERSPAVIRAAREVMFMPQAPNIHIHCCDALEFAVNTAGRTGFDIIFLDLFDADGPSIIYQDLGFILNLVSLLGRDGRVVTNLWKNTSSITRAIINNLSAEFSNPGIRWALPSGLNLLNFNFNFQSGDISGSLREWQDNVMNDPDSLFDGDTRMMEHLSGASLHFPPTGQ